MLFAKRLIEATLTNGMATYYTAGTGMRTRIDAFSVCNYSASAATFTLHLVPTGGTADNSNILVKDRSVGVGLSGRVFEAIGQWIEAAGTIQMVASANSSITVSCSGVQQTGI